MNISRQHYLRNLKTLVAVLGFLVLLLGGAASAQIPFTPMSGANASSERAENAQANKGNDLDIRLNYFRRFPYAKAASEHTLGGADVIIPVEKGHNLMQSKCKLDQNHDAPHRDVVVYQPVIKFCNDDPEDGVCYMQPLLIAGDEPCAFRDLELFNTAMQGTVGMPLSDTQFQILDRENKQRFIELLFDPERYMWLATNTGQMQGAAGANSFAGVAENTFNSAFDRIMQGDGSGGGGGGGGSGGGGGASGGSLINLANENALVPCTAGTIPRMTSQACWMVLKMYHQVFVPIGILLLLPGAVITHTKGMVSQGFMLSNEDASSPWEGILRAMITVFLIPATQLIVSYAIDIGNSLAPSRK